MTPRIEAALEDLDFMFAPENRPWPVPEVAAARVGMTVAGVTRLLQRRRPGTPMTKAFSNAEAMSRKKKVAA